MTWKTIPEFSNYEINEECVIRNKNTLREQTKHIVYGYHVVQMVHDATGKRRGRGVARLMLLTFVGSPPTATHTADHIDRNPLNDSLENLRWATKREQRKNQNRASYKNSEIGVVRIDPNTLEETKFKSLGEAQKTTGINIGNISNCAKGRQRIAGGFMWKYEDESDDLPGEVWTRVKQRDGTEYEKDPKIDVSQFGRLRDRRCGGVLKKKTSDYISESRNRENKRYPAISIGRENNRFIHEIFATTLLGSAPAKSMVVNHKNGDIFDTSIDNLEWISRSGNTNHGHDSGKYAGKKTERQIVVRTCIKTGETKEFQSIQDAARYMGKQKYESCIRQCLYGRLKRAYGYTWSKPSSNAIAVTVDSDCLVCSG
jgi:hypothetical protein